MKITRLEITDYRGIGHLAIDVPPAGVVIKGQNAEGKTSVLRAIQAALAAQGCDPSDIRIGAEQAEILVNLDKLRIRRAITASGPSLSVKNADGDSWSKPATRLAEMLGTAPLDALDFYLAPATKRRQMVLQAMPAKVTEEDLARWMPGVEVKEFGIDFGAHGVEVIGEFRKVFYTRRTDANKKAKDAARDWKAASDAAPETPPAPVDETALRADVEKATQVIRQLDSRDETVARMREANAGTRTRIAELRQQAVDMRSMLTGNELPDGAMALADQAVEETQAKVDALVAQLAQAEIDRDQALRAQDVVRRATNAASDKRERARSMDGQADDLERTIAAQESMVVSQADRDQAVANLEAAQAALAAAEEAKKQWQAHGAMIQAKMTADIAAAAAKRLDGIVKVLSEDAPRELAARAGTIPGLSLDGDRLTLDGRDLEALSGAEQMAFAVQLARRLNAKVKILVVDGMERLDAVRGVDFVKQATADGWQLIATRVDNGKMVVEAIEV